MFAQWEWPIVLSVCGMFSLLITSWIFKKEERKREKRIVLGRLRETA